MDTSMGFTPLSGLMMGTRCGSVDPSLIQFACQTLNKSVDDVTHDMNKNSGLKAMSANGDFDMRLLLQQMENKDDDNGSAAKLAVDMFVYRLNQHIASSMIALEGPLDAIVFTAGIGEQSVDIRSMACQKLQQSLLPGLALDPARNAAHGKDSNRVLTADGAAGPVVLAIPTDEEIMIAKECLRLVSS